MREGIPFINGNCMADTISRVQNNASCTATSIKGENGLDGNIHSWGVESLKHNLGHFLTIGLGVEGSFCEENWMLFRGHTELIVEGVMPNLLHVIPIANNTMLNWVLQSQYTSL
uniref:Actin-like n=1 Tax=Rhizophora mucronata TaxID=61149 RepID=A0A2P2MEY9_RHIMU